jgi:FKBP-type peptidyl-prolyl cis-trans isomerase
MQASEAFLAENQKRPGVKTTASGLQYEVLVQGTGTRPTPNDTITAHYRGTLIDGTEFDNSYKRGEPLTLQLGSVIAGWIEGMQLMPTGSKYKLYIPYQLGYGMNTTGSIPGGSTLIFEVELLKVNGKE